MLLLDMFKKKKRLLFTYLNVQSQESTFLLTTINLIAHVQTVLSVVTDKILRYALSGSTGELVSGTGNLWTGHR